MLKLLTTEDVAERLSVSKHVALCLLQEHGFRPVALGRGRGRRNRWLESDVGRLIEELHSAAQIA